MYNIGDTITIQLTGVIDTNKTEDGSFRVASPSQDTNYQHFAWISEENIVKPRPPWEVLEEAHFIMRRERPHFFYDDLLAVATGLQAAAAPKVPTLAEAVRAFLDAPQCGELHTLKALREALSRAEAGQ